MDELVKCYEFVQRGVVHFSCSTLVPHVSLVFVATVFECLFGIRLGTLICDDLMLHLWPMPPFHFLCVCCFNGAFSLVCSHG